MITLKTGSKLKSAVCDTQIMIIKASPEPLDLRCGGSPLIEATAPAPAGVALDAGFAGGTMIGKRYINEAGSIELLCTKGGKGSLSIGTKELAVKQPKALPSSD